MIQNLKDKNIILFCPKFFNYDQYIFNEIKRQGAHAFLFDERAETNTIEKVFIRLGLLFFINKKIKKYYLEIFQKFNNNFFDFILFINAETCTPRLLDIIKKKQKKSQLILYMWDSLKNKPNTKKIICKFDTVYSFDEDDCKKNNFIFRPLFFISSFDIFNENTECIPKKIDLCFIGTIHSDRFSILKKLQEFCMEHNLSYFFYLYFPSRIHFLIKKIFDKDFYMIQKSRFNFEPISHNEIHRITSESKLIVDIQHPLQKGLTIRTLEMIGCKKKILTTNKDIQNYDFYHPENILIIDRENPFFDVNLLNTEYNTIPKVILDKYSLEYWVHFILS